MANAIEAWEADANWFKGEFRRNGKPEPSEADVENFCERVAILMTDGGYKFDYMARQAAYDEHMRRAGNGVR